MPDHRLAGAPLDFGDLRIELEVPGEFSAAALAQAERAAAAALPDQADRTDLELVTVDPRGSLDLDQAMHLARHEDGYLVSYAISDVGSFVEPGSPLDDELQARGETLYFPDLRVPLHPAVLSEGAASLLPGVVRPSVLWQTTLDAQGQTQAVDVRRALVRSRVQFDYGEVQHAIDHGNPHPSLALLPQIGALRLARARERHAINLDLPEQDVQPDGNGGWTLRLRDVLPVEAWNAEISLLTGMCAAQLMLDAGIGILRTVPAPDARVIDSLRRLAPALDVDWPSGALAGDVLARLSRSDPRQVAFMDHAVSLLRGAAYQAFDGAPPAEHLHAGIGAAYAHVTAPLRRLVDRYGSELCLAAAAKQPVPSWVLDRLPQLPATMDAADHRAHAVDRAVVDTTEAWLLRDRVGQVFDAIVLDADPRAATISLDQPAVRARCTGRALRPGGRIRARLVSADVATRTVRFEAI